MNVDAILKEALEKPANERAEIAEMLISSLEDQSDPDAEKVWQEEINKRLAQIDSGEKKTIPWNDVYNKLYGRTSTPR